MELPRLQEALKQMETPAELSPRQQALSAAIRERSESILRKFHAWQQVKSAKGDPEALRRSMREQISQLLQQLGTTLLPKLESDLRQDGGPASRTKIQQRIRSINATLQYCSVEIQKNQLDDLVSQQEARQQELTAIRDLLKAIPARGIRDRIAQLVPRLQEASPADLAQKMKENTNRTKLWEGPGLAILDSSGTAEKAENAKIALSLTSAEELKVKNLEELKAADSASFSQEELSAAQAKLAEAMAHRDTFCQEEQLPTDKDELKSAADALDFFEKELIKKVECWGKDAEGYGKGLPDAEWTQKAHELVADIMRMCKNGSAEEREHMTQELEQMFKKSVMVFADKYKDAGVTEAEAWALATYTTSEYVKMNALGRGIDYQQYGEMTAAERESYKQQEAKMYEFRTQLEDYRRSLGLRDNDSPTVPLTNPPQEWELQAFRKALEAYSQAAKEAAQLKTRINLKDDTVDVDALPALIERYNALLKKHDLPDDVERLTHMSQPPPQLPPENRVSEQVNLEHSKTAIDEAVQLKTKIDLNDDVDALPALIERYTALLKRHDLPDDLNTLVKLADAPANPDGVVQQKVQRPDLARRALQMPDGDRAGFCAKHELPEEPSKLQQMIDVSMATSALHGSVATDETALQNQLVNKLLMKVAKQRQGDGASEITVYRGMDTSKLSPKVLEMWESYAPGSEFVESGFMSTAKSQSPDFENGIVLIIKLKPEIPQIGCAELSAYPSENEILLASGTRFKVLSVEPRKEVEYTDSDGQVTETKTQRVITVEALSR